MSGYVVAVVGATGLVGGKMIECLEERDFPVKKFLALASARSEAKGLTVRFRGQEYPVLETKAESFDGVDIVLFAGGGTASQEFAWEAAARGAMVVDNSSAWRMDERCPLVVPEVNAEALEKNQGVIANPNCSTIQMVVALKPIHDAAGIDRVVVSTYQSVSGTGRDAVEELENQTRALQAGRDWPPKAYPHPIAFNVLPHIDRFQENGYTREEMKMVNETRKILGDDSIRITATTVRVPVYFGHSESVNVKTKKKLTAAQAREVLSAAPGVKVVDDPAPTEADPNRRTYPLPIQAEGTDLTYVGRIREDISQENGLELWVVADNIRKGAASNAVQIAEVLIQRGLVGSRAKINSSAKSFS